jgi:hypothetical protein
MWGGSVLGLVMSALSVGMLGLMSAVKWVVDDRRRSLVRV